VRCYQRHRLERQHFFHLRSVWAYGLVIHTNGPDFLSVAFHGVRGSTACHGADTARYGGNTSCVSLSAPGNDPLLFDLGTGLRYFGLSQPANTPFRGNCLLSHYHWDHVQGLPFFTPLLRADSELDIFGPAPEDGRSVAEVMNETIRPPWFPVTLDDLPGTVRFHDVGHLAAGDPGFVLAPRDESADGFEVMVREAPHSGRSAGFRVTWAGRTVTYLSDHQQPIDGPFEITEGVRELCASADVLIHDAQYTAAEFALREDWGHCTVEFAVWVAITTGVKTLVLFHHDPTHSDDLIDVLTTQAAACGRASGLEVVSAHEGLMLRV